ncbi:small integral membrane protein 29-like [Conger conger]|uniref:small integral membrane protein 29-like n=1 Tax=Conger conger TaxID=82655 RepID=UPI002A599540|nr:small integral membrane protein 29-like [Conger conger]XP_061076715.1 small integral membrane protein 29-like [Conger conger]XP_061076716.1 small integral membrane protein 29-like [Conger conger]XP_061076717.1 small integral membrane protein 29-like [Conger conger]XP_061076718.1 small integral membrane protein 29-like [Conger conger]
MNTTTPSIQGDGMIHYMLVPMFFIAVIGVSTAGVLYMLKKRRIDRLRHQLVPVYTYDPSEAEDGEREVLLRNENMESWTGFYQHQHPSLVKNSSAGEVGYMLKQDWL